MPLFVTDKIKGALRELRSLDKPGPKRQVGAYCVPEEMIQLQLGRHVPPAAIAAYHSKTGNH
jgi:hypothetical protein